MGVAVVTKTRKLLTEVIYPTSFALVERQDEGGNKKWYLEGEFGVVDTPTANGRIYPRRIMEREIERLRPEIQARRLYGEAEHPEDGKTSLRRVSHLITDLWIEGNKVKGRALLLDTDAGRNLKAILEAGGQIGASSRGWGDTVEDGNGNAVVREDFQLVTFDFVASPSAGVYPQLVVEEKLIVGKKGGKIMDVKTLNDLKQADPELFQKLLQEAQEEIRRGASAESGGEGEAKGANEQGVDVNRLTEQFNELADITKRLGFELFMERNYGRHPQFAKIRELVGDVSKYDSVEELRTQIESILDILPKEEVTEGGNGDEGRVTSGNTGEEELREMKETLREVTHGVRKMRVENLMLRRKARYLMQAVEKYRQALEEALELAREMGILAYAHKKLRFHPDPESVIESLKSGRYDTIERVNRLIEETAKQGSGGRRESKSLTESSFRGAGKDLNERETPDISGSIETEDNNDNNDEIVPPEGIKWVI